MKFLHTMFRVKDLNKSIEFYTKVLGLEIIRKNDFPEKKYTLVFLGFGSTEKDIILELTYNWGEFEYNIGDGFGHIAFSTSNLPKIVSDVKSFGCKILREPGVLKTSAGKDVTFVTDPDGYAIEIIENAIG